MRLRLLVALSCLTTTAFAQEAAPARAPEDDVPLKASEGSAPAAVEVAPAAVEVTAPAAVEVTAPSYDILRGAAAGEANAGRFEAAAAIVERALSKFPDDYQLHLDHAYYLFQAGAYQRATAAYLATLAINPESRDARLGLGWSALRMGDRVEARRRFTEVLDSASLVASARSGLELAGPDTLYLPRVFGQGQLFLNDATHGSLWNLTAGMDVRLRDRWLVGAWYRHIGDASLPSGATSNYQFGQDEGHLSLGYDGRRFGASVYGSLVAYPAWSLDSTAVGKDIMGLGGVELRARAWATFALAVTYTRYPGQNLVQLDLGATLPVHSLLDVWAGGRMEIDASGQVHGAARLEARLHRHRWIAALTGQAGSEWRPYDIATRAVYDLNDTLLYGAGAYGWAPIATHIDAFASLQWERWLSATAGGADADSLRITLGLGAWF